MLLPALRTAGLADITAHAGVPQLLLSLLRSFRGSGGAEAFAVAAIAVQLMSGAPAGSGWGRETGLLAEVEACLAQPEAAMAMLVLLQLPQVHVITDWLRGDGKSVWSVHTPESVHPDCSPYGLLCRGVAGLRACHSVSASCPVHSMSFLGFSAACLCAAPFII